MIVYANTLPPEERFWLNVEKIPFHPCWVWTGSLNKSSGYGQMGVRGKLTYVHRFSWSLHNGREIPRGMQVCHTCDNRVCVRPDHLYMGTARKNAADRERRTGSWQKKKTHCPRGHEYSLQNTRIKISRRGTARDCRTCDRDRARLKFGYKGDPNHWRRWGEAK